MLCRRNDALVNPALRSGSPWYNLPCFASPVGRYDCCRNPHQQDGTGATTGLRSDARTPMGHIHGKLCEWRRILPLQLLGHKGVRQDRAGGHICAGMPSHCRGSDVRHLSIAEEDAAYQDHTDVVQKVKVLFVWRFGGGGHYACDFGVSTPPCTNQLHTRKTESSPHGLSMPPCYLLRLIRPCSRRQPMVSPRPNILIEFRHALQDCQHCFLSRIRSSKLTHRTLLPPQSALSSQWHMRHGV